MFDFRKMQMHGFTLMEMMITVAILAVVMALAIPNMQSFFDAKRAIGAAEQVYQHLQQAKVEAIARSKPTYFVFSGSGTTTWKYGLSEISGCNPAHTLAGASPCVIVIDDGDGTIDDGTGTIDAADRVLSTFDSSEYSDVTMSINNTTISFDYIRGIATPATTITVVSAGGKELYVNVSALGQLSICTSADASKKVPGYTTGC